jgi:hypothetical protein
MNKLLIIILLLLQSWNAFNQNAPKLHIETPNQNNVFKLDTVASGTIVKFPIKIKNIGNAPLNHQFDLGAVLQGEDKIVSIPIKNIGNRPLIIKSVSANNTAPTWTTTPIMPNEMGVIEMKCSTDRVGPFRYSFRVITTEMNDAYKGSFRVRVVARADK